MIIIKRLALVRIDDRLIHGQVIAVWVKHKKFTKIQIVDDGLASDPFMVDVFAGSTVWFEVLAETRETSIKSSIEPNTTISMIMMKSPHDRHRLYDSVITFNAFNNGVWEWSGRKNVFKNSSISKEEYQYSSPTRQRCKITFLSVLWEKSKDFAESPLFKFNRGEIVNT